MRIYTDNKDTCADPQYTGSDDTAAGLVDTAVTTKRLPMCWRIMDDTTSYNSNLIISSEITETTTDSQDFHLMKDETNDNPVFGSGYEIVWEEGGDGLHVKEDDEDSPSDRVAYIYIGAKFTNAALGKTYKTSKLTLEMYTE